MVPVSAGPGLPADVTRGEIVALVLVIIAIFAVCVLLVEAY